MLEMHRKYDYVVKLVMVGTSAVGKSAILKRFADNEYNEFYISTIGIDFRFKSLSIGDDYVKLQIWDTAGQQRFKGIAKSYYNNADAVLMVYDVNDQKSFDDMLKVWLKEVRTYCRNDVKVYVLCNKCDSNSQNIKSSQKVVLEQQQIKWYLTSAKTGRGVSEAIVQIGKEVIKTMPRIEERAMSMELRQLHYTGDRKKKCCEK